MIEIAINTVSKRMSMLAVSDPEDDRGREYWTEVGGRYWTEVGGEEYRKLMTVLPLLEPNNKTYGKLWDLYVLSDEEFNAILEGV